MAENEEERTEQATPRRRQRAREQGQIARSRELVGMATMAGGMAVFAVAGAAVLRNVSGLTGRLLGLGYGRDAATVLRAASTEMLWILAPFFAATVVMALVSNVVQGGFVFKPLAMDPAKLNPLNGIKNLFSLSSLPGIVKSLFKFLIGGVLFYFIMKDLVAAAPATAVLGVEDIRRTAFSMTGKAVTSVFSTFFVISLADYAIERWRFERSLRMTRDEIREEHKETDGDPHVKARIRSIQKDMARRRMMEQVPRATVVITNPTHIAVALRYEKDEMAAPTVIAKGQDLVAETIKAVARRHGIPLVEDRPLARSLVKVKLDAAIPVELYRAVAKILAHLAALRGAAAPGNPQVSKESLHSRGNA